MGRSTDPSCRQWQHPIDQHAPGTLVNGTIAYSYIYIYICSVASALYFELTVVTSIYPLFIVWYDSAPRLPSLDDTSRG